MGEGLKRKIGPLPVWGWVLIAGGTIGGVLLWKKAKGKEAAEQGEPVPEHLTAGLPEIGGGGGGGGESPDAQLRQELGEAKGRLEGNPGAASSPGSTTATPVSDFLTTEHELREGGWQRASEGNPAATGSTANATAKALTASKGGHAGRGGVTFKTGNVGGHAAHIYSQAVPGGVGPGHNIIVLNPSHGNKAPHSKTPSHTRKAPPKRSHSKPARPTVHRSNINIKAKRRARF